MENLRKMTFYAWSRRRRKGFVRCHKCARDILPSQDYLPVVIPDEDGNNKRVLLCKFCAEEDEAVKR